MNKLTELQTAIHDCMGYQRVPCAFCECKGKRWLFKCSWCNGHGEFEIKDRDYRLADVLMCLNHEYMIMTDGEIGRFNNHHNMWDGTGVVWNLRESLSNQSPETIAFLHSLI